MAKSTRGRLTIHQSFDVAQACSELVESDGEPVEPLTTHQNGWTKITHRNRPLEKMRQTIEQCENCRCAIYAFGLSRPILICYNKAGREGSFFVISPNENCKNFKPKEHLAEPILHTFESDGAKLIPLTQGKFAIVDADDYDRLAKRKWLCKQDGNTSYAYTFIRKAGKKNRVSMHRQIMQAPKGMIVDHTDGNGLNNRKSNLRLCSSAQNAWNKRPAISGYSRYKGITWHKHHNKWYVSISKFGKSTFLGCFDNQSEAALAYDRKAEELFGQFAYLNFPQLAEFRKFARKIVFSA